VTAAVVTERSLPDRPPVTTVSRVRALPEPRLAAGFGLIVLAALLVVFLIVELLGGAVLQQRDQHDLAARFRTEALHATQRAAAVAALQAYQQREASGQQVIGVRGPQSPPPDANDLTRLAPLPGRPVAVLQIPLLGVEQVVVEGVRSQDLRQGPGHVPGTALPGQPGTAALVARRSTWGAVFRHLDLLRSGDRIVVTTVQGRSTYVVSSSHGAGRTDPFADATTGGRLVLASTTPPLVGSGLLVVDAELLGSPHVPTPRGARDLAADGTHADFTALPGFLILVQLLLLAVVGGAVLYRRWQATPAWLVSTPVVLALAVLAARAADGLLPPAL
jgi:sortase A